MANTFFRLNQTKNKASKLFRTFFKAVEKTVHHFLHFLNQQIRPNCNRNSRNTLINCISNNLFKYESKNRPVSNLATLP